MANKFTVKAQNALEGAEREARSLGHTYIGSEHILLGLLGVGDSIASKLLVARGVSFGEEFAQVVWHSLPCQSR